MALPLFWAKSSISAFVVAEVFSVSLLTRKGFSMKCNSLDALDDPSFLPKAESDDGIPIGRLLLSDVAGPWLTVGLLELFCNICRLERVDYIKKNQNTTAIA